RSVLDLGGCARGGEVEVALTFELTYDEIAAVRARAADPELAACAEAAVWRASIAPGTFTEPRAAGELTVTVEAAPPR
ncbi:MAG: hypothetical protein ABMA64_42200, partial [Myxococcota bacterium]